MFHSYTTKLLTLFVGLFIFIAAPVFGDDTASKADSATTQTAAAQESETEKAVVVVLDPEIAGTVDEEPDCE